MWSNLKAGSPFRVQVTKTFNPVGEVPDDVTVNDATVVILKNGKEYISLSRSTEPGIYISDSLVSAGSAYAVQVSSPEFPTAESSAVTVPLELPQVTIIRSNDVTPQSNYQTPQDLLSFYFREEDALSERYFSIKLMSYYANDTISSYPEASADNIAAHEEDCHAWAIEVEKPKYYEDIDILVSPQSPVFLMSNQCLPEPDIPLKFYIETGSGFNYTNRALKVTARIGAISKDFFEHTKIEGKQPEGVDHLVLPPQKALSNISNGFGLVFASNEKIIELP